MPRRTRDPLEHLATAQHEAAHVVVGVHLGLRLRRVELLAPVGASANGWFDVSWGGLVWFERGPAAALALMYAAGVAWEGALGSTSPADARLVREIMPGRGSVKACARAAGALLAGLGTAHARVTRALLEAGTLTGADIAAIARGEKLPAD
jgi:hypothetical protein